MDFGIIYELSVPRPWTATSERDAYWNCIEQVRVAEESGFSHVWAVEHHFLTEFSHSAAPEVWLTAVAQHTSRIRIGHGVVLTPPPFNHPVRVAERLAALDILSNGRLEFGTGRSITKTELGGFCIDPGDTRGMWYEGLDLISKIWQNEGPISYEGKFVQMPERRVQPRPVQQPHPPMWTACTSPPSYELAGSLGLGVLGFGMAIDRETMRKRAAEYRSALSVCTPIGAVKNDNIAVFLMTYCAKTDAEARKIAQESFTYYMAKSLEHFLNWGEGDPPPGYEWYAKATKSPDLAAHMTFDYLFENGMILCGSPDTICTEIARWNDVGMSQVLMGKQIYRIAHEDTIKSIRLLGEAVLPQVRELVPPMPEVTGVPVIP